MRALNNALERDRLHHAYLFTGTRGVGKTTLARIFAKSLNCEQGVTAEPCGQCGACLEIDEGRFVDLMEVDAASRTKVDQTRELLDNVPYAPVRGRYKVYLIDEVHMFSSSSFNALLKTLEEPPPHVKFLLATTDPQKVPVTVLSRCLQFNLKRLLTDQIQGQLQHILEQEALEHEVGALGLLSLAADGSMRDALSLLDQAIAFGGGKVEEGDVRSMLGTLSRDLVIGVLEALAQGNAQSVLGKVESIAERTPDFAALLKDLLAILHRVAVAQLAPDSAGMEQDPREAELARSISPADVQLFYQIGLMGQKDLELAPDPKTGLEMVLLRMLAFRPDAGAVDGSASAPASALRSKPGERAMAPTAAPPQAASVVAQQPPPQAPESIPPAAPARLQTVDDWHALVASLGLQAMAKQLAENCEFESWDGKQLNLRLDAGRQGVRVGASEKRMTEALKKALGADINVGIRIANTETETPAQREQRLQRERQEQAERNLMQDPVVQALQDNFGATLTPGSIQALDQN